MTKKEKVLISVVVLSVWAVVSLLSIMFVPSGMEEARYAALIVVWSLFSLGLFFCILFAISDRGCPSEGSHTGFCRRP